MKTTYVVQLIDPNLLIEPDVTPTYSLEGALTFITKIREANKNKEYTIKLIITQTKE